MAFPQGAFKSPNPVAGTPASDPSPTPASAPSTPAPQGADGMAALASLLTPAMLEALRPHFAPAGTDTRPVVYSINGVGDWKPAEGERPHFMFPLLLALAATGEHLYLWEGAGTAKSHTAEMLARALNREHRMDSFSAQTSEAKIAGFIDAQGRPVITPVAEAFEHGHIFIADEFDAGSAPSVVMNRLLANGSATLAGRALNRHQNFQVFATANTRGSGQADGFRREPIDAATLDRFFMVRLPQDIALERHLCGLPVRSQDVQTCAIDRGGKVDPEAWHAFLTRARDAARSLAIKATFLTSMRPARTGCKLAAAGIGKYWLAQGLIRRSLGDNDWVKLAAALDIEP